MTLTWGTYRAQLRRSILKAPEQEPWSDDALRDFLWSALDTFTAHTAAETGVTYAATGTSYQLPDNMYEDPEVAGLVWLSNGTDFKFCSPMRYPAPDLGDTVFTFTTFPGNVLTLSDTPATGYTLNVRYFAYYNHPYADSDVVGVPQWAIPALSHLIAALALTPEGVGSSNISQWKDRSDSGNPEHNALRAQQKWMLDMYHCLLSGHPSQERTAHYRNFPGKLWTLQLST